MISSSRVTVSSPLNMFYQPLFLLLAALPIYAKPLRRAPEGVPQYVLDYGMLLSRFVNLSENRVRLPSMFDGLLFGVLQMIVHFTFECTSFSFSTMCHPDLDILNIFTSSNVLTASISSSTGLAPFRRKILSLRYRRPSSQHRAASQLRPSRKRTKPTRSQQSPSTEWRCLLNF